VFHILLALADGEKHGYAIMKDVETQSDGRIKMGPGTLYGSIKRMLAAGLIEESGQRPDPSMDDERRRYYRLTGLGQKVASAESQRMVDLVKVALQKHILSIYPKIRKFHFFIFKNLRFLNIKKWFPNFRIGSYSFIIAENFYGKQALD
jgi:DNA-binding PadR family transcriptional regulator